jgi:hypothetical protein
LIKFADLARLQEKSPLRFALFGGEVPCRELSRPAFRKFEEY